MQSCFSSVASRVENGLDWSRGGYELFLGSINPGGVKNFDLILCSEGWSSKRPPAAVQLQPVTATATESKPLQSHRCAGPSTCQDLLCFHCPHYVFYCHIPTAPHKIPAFCGQSCSRKTRSPCQLHMRTLWEPHVILMKGSAQTGYRFSQPPLKNIRISCFCSEICQE